MTYQEMVDALAAMDEQERRRAIQEHWQAVFSDGFIAFVQGQLEAGRQMAQSSAGFGQVFAELDPSFVAVLKEQASAQLARLTEIWHSLAAVYEKLQTESERQGNPQGMVAHGKHRAMPRGISVAPAVGCFRCGSQAVGQGLCSGCLATQQDWEQQDSEYERQLYDRQQQEIEHHRLQNDQLYYDNQQDFNTHTTYHTEY